MSFENRFGSDQRATEAYVARMLALLGEQEPLEVLCATSAELARRLERFEPGALQKPESDGRWSAFHVLQHLADAEFAFGFRARMALAHDRPALGGFDQDAWAARLQYGRAEAAVLLAAFDAMRAFNILLYRNLAPEDLERETLHAERGVETLRQMLRLNAAHDLAHLRQIDRIYTKVHAGEG